MMRLIDADAFELIVTEKFKEHYGDTVYQFIHDFSKFVIRQIRKASTIDAVEVVRCKDCVWYAPCTEWGIDAITGRYDHSKIVVKTFGECRGQDFAFTEDGCLRVGADDFCSCGERKSE